MLSTVKSWIDKTKQVRERSRLKDSDYEFIFDDIEEDVYVCFDCETTGLDRKNDRIITLSAIKIQNNELQTSTSLNLVVKQPEDISEESILVHQIRNVDVVNSDFVYSNEQEAIADFLQFIRGTTLVGYFLEFDVAMVERVLKPWLGVGLPNPQIDVGDLYYDYARSQIVRSCIEPNIDLSFDHILQQLGLPNLGQHDAYNDALMTALIFLKMKQI
jgi:DNA polymerase-3 subunit epsilon